MGFRGGLWGVASGTRTNWEMLFPNPCFARHEGRGNLGKLFEPTGCGLLVGFGKQSEPPVLQQKPEHDLDIGFMHQLVGDTGDSDFRSMRGCSWSPKFGVS